MYVCLDFSQKYSGKNILTTLKDTTVNFINSYANQLKKKVKITPLQRKNKMELIHELLKSLT
jgi:hypothetical protein